MFPVPIWAKLLGILAVAIIAFGSGWKYRADIAERDRLALQVASFVAREGIQAKADEEARKLEKALKAVHIHAQSIEGELFDELQKPVYRDCIVPADGVRIINRAISDER